MAPCLVKASTAASALVLVERLHGRSEWCFADTLRPDPLTHRLQTAVAAPDQPALSVVWTAGRGRCVQTQRRVHRGELLMTVPALAFASLDGGSSTACADVSACVEHLEGEADASSIALVIAVLQHSETRDLAHALCGVPQAGMQHLEGHTRWRNVSAVLRRMAGLPPSSALGAGSPSDGAIAEIAQCVHANLHRAQDEQTATRAVGVGLYPAACLLNHSCAPSCCLSWSDSGRVLHVRAITDVAAGEELTYSYLAEEQLYAPFEERAALLRLVHRFELAPTAERRAAELACSGWGGMDDGLAGRARAAIAAAHRATAAADTTTLRAALEALETFISRQLEGGAVHPFHWLVQEVHAALLAIGRALDEPRVVAKCALHLLTAREAALSRGTLHLAALYSAHGSAIHRLLRERQVPQSERSAAANAAVASMSAAARIRDCCLGSAHPLTLATKSALERVR